MGEVNVKNLFGEYVKVRNQPFDNIYTPEELAKEMVEYFKPKGKILEPCAGSGSFLKFLPKKTDWCEIDKDRNFFDYKKKVDWIITNPPFSKLTEFLLHSMKIAKEIVFIINLSALFSVKRIKIIKQNDFVLQEILFLRQPETFVQCGRQLSAIHLSKCEISDSTFTKLTYHKDLLKSYEIKPGKRKWLMSAKKRGRVKK